MVCYNSQLRIPARNLRIYLLRLNAENQTMVRVLKAINSDEIKPKIRSAECGILQAYLNKATANILKLSKRSREFAATDHNLMSLAAIAAEGFISPEERQSALNHLENLQIRKNVFRKMKSLHLLDEGEASSVADHGADRAQSDQKRQSRPTDIFTIKPSIWGLSVDVKEAFRYGIKWWRENR
jgi:hypothetical protein